jgi:ATP-dependent DNA helicase RecG
MAEKTFEKELSRGESQFLSFISSCTVGKSGKVRAKKISELSLEASETLSSMANSDGGALFMGVDAQGEISEIEIPEKSMVDIFDHAKRLLRPEPGLRFEIAEIGSKKILKIFVDKSPIPVTLEDGRYLFRLWSKNYPMRSQDISTLKREKMKILYEREFLEGPSFDDLDKTLVDKVCASMGWKGKPFELFRSRFGLVDYHGNEEKITRAALLLFSPDQKRWNPGGGIDFTRFESPSSQRPGRENVVERIRIERPLLQLVHESFEVVGKHIKEKKTFHDLFTVEKYEYPFFAWKEAILNAVIHRDYSIQGSPIEILMYDDQLEIRSPGLLPEPLSLAHISMKERGHISRNPLISRVFSEMGYITERGRGILGIFEDMENNNLSPPEFREEGFLFCVALKNTPVFDEKTQAWLMSFSDLHLNIRQKRILAWAFNHGYRFSSRDYQKLGRVDRDLAYREILELEKMHLVQTEGKGKYKISDEKL